MKKKLTIRIEINNWSKLKPKQKTKALVWIAGILQDVVYGAKLSDKFWGEHYK